MDYTFSTENPRLDALARRDAVNYAKACSDEGIFPEDQDLFDLGALVLNHDCASIKQTLKDMHAKPKPKPLNYLQMQFLREAKALYMRVCPKGDALADTPTRLQAEEMRALLVQYHVGRFRANKVQDLTVQHPMKAIKPFLNTYRNYATRLNAMQEREYYEAYLEDKLFQ